MEEGQCEFLVGKSRFSFTRRDSYDKLREALKELKTCTSNESNNNTVNLQCEDVLARLKQMDGHVT